MATDRNTIKSWFVRGAKPLASQFSAWIDSFWHKNDKIPMSAIEGLTDTLNAKSEGADITALQQAIDGKYDAADGQNNAQNIEQINEKIANIGDGKNAYQIAVDNGYVGSETEWLEMLNVTQQVVWIDNFAGCAGTAKITTLAGSVDGYTANYDLSGNVYCNGGGVKLGIATNIGTITTPRLNKIGYVRTLEITFKADAWTSGQQLKITAFDDDTNEIIAINIVPLTSVIADAPSGIVNMTGTRYTVSVNGCSASTRLRFELANSVDKRFLFDDLTIKATTDRGAYPSLDEVLAQIDTKIAAANKYTDDKIGEFVEITDAEVDEITNS